MPTVRGYAPLDVACTYPVGPETTAGAGPAMCGQLTRTFNAGWEPRCGRHLSIDVAATLEALRDRRSHRQRYHAQLLDFWRAARVGAVVLALALGGCCLSGSTCACVCAPPDMAPPGCGAR